MRSFEQVWQISNNLDGKFASIYIKTKWPIYIEEVLQKAFDIGLGLVKSSILIHCPTGDDGSSVMCSLAQIIMDPFYRSFEGFKTIVYKEWLHFQHNFVKRSALLMQGMNGEQVSGQVIASDLKASRLQMQAWPNVNNCKDYAPYFIFFLDCVN